MSRINLRDHAFYREYNPYIVATQTNSAPAVESVKPVAPVSPVVKAAQLQRVEQAREKSQREKRDNLAYTIQTVSLKELAHLPIIVAQFPLIRSLDLRRCKALTDEAFQHIAELHELERLVVRGCRGVTISRLEALSNLTFLRQIDARQCPDFYVDSQLGTRESMPNCRIRCDD